MRSVLSNTPSDLTLLARRLRKAISQLKERFEGVAISLEEIPPLDERARATVQEEMDRIKKTALEGDPAFLRDLVASQPEQAEITRRWSAYRGCLIAVRDCFDETRGALVALMPVSEPARNAVDAIDKVPAVASIDLNRLRPRSILADLNTLEGILGSLLNVKATAKSIGAVRRSPKNVEIIKEVQKLSAANLSDIEICARLGNSARPEGATWAAVPWPNALKTNRNAVSKWLSEARRRRLP
jgi:hypothetical protein